MWKNYLRYVHDDGRYYCVDCAQKLYSTKNATSTKLSKSLSFGEWLTNTYGEDAINIYWSNKNVLHMEKSRV